jgi:tricorn protease
VFQANRFVLTAELTCLAFSLHARAAEVGYYSQPALHGDQLVFVSEGDLWSATIPAQADATSIIAYRLSSSEGVESRPCISPDGKMLAFSAQYDGNTDVFVMPIDGGPPKRLTFHPANDVALGWTPDSQYVLFSSPRVQPLGRPELWRISPTFGGMPERYAFGECTMIGFSSTGKRFAFTRWSNEHWTWKRYRGGTAPDIWLGDLNTESFSKLTDDRANDMFPMWLLDRVFFLTDRSGTANIFSDSPNMPAPGKDIKQHTQFAPDPKNPTAVAGYDARWPSADSARGGKTIVFCQAGELALLDVTNNNVRRLDVRLASDRVAARQRFAKLNETITEYDISPDGNYLLVGSRGEIMRIPVEGGAAQQVTRTSTAREWGASHLGKDQIVMITDSSGEQQVATAPIDGTSQPALMTQDRVDWLFPPIGSPDGKWIAFADKTLRLHVLNVDTLERLQIDQSEAGEIRDYRFSPDSQWLAYAKPMPNGQSMVSLAALRTGRTFAVSNGLSDDGAPRWDPAGKYLYFLSDRHLNPVMSDFDFEHAFIKTTEVYVVPLASDTPPPIKDIARAARFDLEKWAKAPEAKDDDKKDGEDAKGPAEADAGDDLEVEGEKPPTPPTMRVDTEALAARQFKLPIDAGNYNNLEAIYGGVLYVENPVEGLMDNSWPDPPKPKGKLQRYNLVEEEDEVIAEKMRGYAVNQKCDTIAYGVFNDDGKIAKINVIKATEGAKAEPKVVEVDSTQLRVGMRGEWGQILAEAWRLQRDFYWAPNYVGVDWPGMKTKYEALLPRIGTRAELNDLIGQMIGELGTSHTYIWGGQQYEQPKNISVGMLGADIDFDGQGFRIITIVPGQTWGEEEYESPLEPPHLGVKVGSYITAINGIPLAPGMNIYDLLQDQAGKMIRVTIADNAPGGGGGGGGNSRTIEVEALRSEQLLRYAAWVEGNRQYVATRTENQCGYLHIPDMGGDGLVMFARYFYPQYDKPGLVIDVRDNGGGFVSQMIVQRLARKPIAFDQPRHGVTGRYPQRALEAHLVTLIDQHAGSDGDIFPNSFRKLGLGPLIGTRTWGGVVGIRGDKPFVDMGLSTQPEFAWWESEGGWVIENEGVSPDIEVDITPADRVAGRDPQLDRGIEWLVEKIRTEPRTMPPVPPWPVRAHSGK